ncbi:MAG: L-threonylcarbamoyladenylate synthase [Actinomycetota bacterium]|nr:L-threonylcarbamoyladenylate synthase [Actinomycetota bacterium]
MNDIDRAVQVLRAGGLVAIPTETVYGLAADASNPDAVRRIFATKGRPVDHPLIVHIAAAEDLGDWAATIPPSAAVLADSCWPGPLTLLVPHAARVLDVITGGRASIGVRMPAHPLTLELLTRFGGGLAAPSANRFGRVSPTTADHVRADLGNDVDFVLDGGPCPIGVESTIVDCTVEPPQVLRPGAIATDDIATLLNSTLDASSGPSRAAGMLTSHYAPRCHVLLATTLVEAQGLATGRRRTEILDDEDLARYAHSLYARLRDADDRGVETLIAVLPPAVGLGHAIRDRLTKAATPSR